MLGYCCGDLIAQSAEAGKRILMAWMSAIVITRRMRVPPSHPVDCPSTILRFAAAPLRVRMQRVPVVDGDFFSGANVAQREEHDVPVESFHVSVGPARMVDVVRAVSPARAVQTEAAVNVANAQDAPVARSLSRFEIRDSLTGVFGNLLSSLKVNGGETALAVD